MFKVALYMAAIYTFSLNLLVFVFQAIAGGMLSKTAYIHAGIIGTVFVIVCLGYVFRKHYLKKLSRMKAWLDLHVVTGSIGSFLILVHSEFHFRSLVPSLTLIFMELVVISGVIGRSLINHVTKQLSQEKKRSSDLPTEEEDLLVLAFSVSVLKHWKKVHVHITAAVTILIVLHVISELYYRGLRL